MTSKTINPAIHIEKIARVIWIFSLLIFAGICIYSLSSHFIIHAYRQAQTAITALYLPKEGFKLNYSTPIMGYPWTVPMEFPIFQWLAVGLQKISGINLIVSGKFINILCHVINNLLIIQIFKRLKLNSAITAYIGLIFYNLFPFYLVFDSTFLIDSFSLTLNFIAVYFLTGLFKEDKSIPNTLLFFFFALLTGLSKSTTFIGVLAPITAVYLVHQLFQQEGLAKIFSFKLPRIRKIYIAGVFFMVAFAGMYAWVSYSDKVKMGNPLSALWTSANTTTWNFGTLQQRLSLENWKQYFTYSMLAHPIFCLLVAGGIVAFIFYSGRKEKILGLGMLLFFIFPLLFFFNLFFIHTYYGVANAIFLYFILSLIITVLIKHKTIIIRVGGIAFGITLLLFAGYRSFVFRHQILKNEAEAGAYGHLNELNFKPGPDEIIVKVHGSRDPYLEYFFKCRGINLSKGEYEKYGKKDRLKQLSGGLPIRMICIVDEHPFRELPAAYQGILPANIQHRSIYDQAESNQFYNFFWY